MTGVPVIIAGSRNLYRVDLVSLAVQEWCEEHGAISKVVSGAARGMDAAGESWAAALGLPVRRFPADWRQFGNRAGPLRNREMAEYAAAHDGGCVVIHHGSRGSRDMLAAARAYHLRVLEWQVSPEDAPGCM